MTYLPLSEAKARLSEVVRNVRRTGASVVIAVDGEPAVTVSPYTGAPRRLTDAEVAMDKALQDAALRLAVDEPFDAVALVRDGRR